MYANKDPGSTFRKAKEFGISRRAASAMRQRYLTPYLAYFICSGSPAALFWAKEILDEINYLRRHEGGEFTPTERRGPERITDDMIERARNVPVTSLIQFNREGRASAWCHQDQRPSLYIMTRTNRAACPVCNKSFDPIAILTERDGMSFADAVRELAA